MNIFGTQFSIHWSWWIFVLFFAMGPIFSGNTELITWTLFQVISLALIILGHECSHALMASRFGYKTISITLNLFGGLAQISGLEKAKPREDALIAMAGPAFNFLLAISLFVAMIWNPGFLFGLDYVSLSTLGEVSIYLIFINVFVGLFNLFPAYPLDGGRILRAILSPLKNRKLALDISNGLTILFGIGLVILAFFTFNPFIIILAGIFFLMVFQERTEFKKNNSLT